MSATDRMQTRSMKWNQTLRQPTTAGAEFLEPMHPGGERIPHQPRVQAIHQGENRSTEAEFSDNEVNAGIPYEEQIVRQLQKIEIGGTRSTEAEREVNAWKAEQGASVDDEIAKLRAQLAAAEARVEMAEARAEKAEADLNLGKEHDFILCMSTYRHAFTTTMLSSSMPLHVMTSFLMV